MTNKYFIALALAPALALSSGLFAADTGQIMQDMQRTAQERRTQGMSDAASPNVDRAFLAAAISHIRLQRQISEYVSQKATDPEVKKLAQQIYDDQEQLSQKAQKAAKDAGVTIDPDNMLPRDQAVLDFAKELPTQSLERHYVFHEAGAAQTQLLMAQWAAKNAQKPEVKQFAQTLADKLDQRNKNIQQIAQSEINTGSGRTASDQP